MNVELKERAQKDFRESGLHPTEWAAFWIGYLAAIKRFGGRK
jgi:hypothetical protein